MRAHRAVLEQSLPEGWSVAADGPLVIADAPAGADSAAEVARLVSSHAGPVAVAIGLPRCDAVDAVLRMVDEVVLVETADRALQSLVVDELTPLVRQLTVAAPAPSSLTLLRGGERGQSTVVAVAVVATLLAVAIGFGLVASALGRVSDEQGRADVAALAGAKALLEAQPLVYTADRRERIVPSEYRRRGLVAARASGAANGLNVRDIHFVGDRGLPTRIEVEATSAGARPQDRRRVVRATAEVAIAALQPNTSTGDYTGPLAVRQGQRMRPDVALAFDRMQAAASADGHALVITSAYRSDAEQAELFRRHPDPKWVAPPGKSLHRLGTELDLGPNSAWPWLAANATRFGFLQRYSWEAWHFGYTRSAGSASVGYGNSGAASRDDDGESHEASGSAIPSFVPSRYAAMISTASQRWSVGAALLGAQLYVESGFEPGAVSPAGAAGIAQFMPGTAATYGLTPAERFDPAKAIDAQGHLMHDLLRKFASVPLALAAYNAGDGRVAPCMCVPAIPETQEYVQKILALLGGAGIAAPAGLQIRLVG